MGEPGKQLIKHLVQDWYKYLLEIIVVILGILIAFALNNWNETRKNQQLKYNYLEALKVDIQSDIQNLQDWKDGSDHAEEEEGMYLLSFLEERLQEKDSQRLVRSFLMSQYKPSISISSSTYNDLMNSGNISIFKDLAFKKQLDEYYKTDTWSAQIDERIIQTMWYDYRNKITEFIDPTIFREIYSSQLQPGELTKSNLLQYSIDWKAIKQSPLLLKELRNVLAWRVWIRYNLTNHIERANKILQLLDSE